VTETKYIFCLCEVMSNRLVFNTLLCYFPTNAVQYHHASPWVCSAIWVQKDQF